MTAVWLAAALGLALLACAAALSVWAARAALRRGLSAGLVALLLPTGIGMAVLCAALPYHDGNEPLNFVTSLVGAFSGFDLVQYPHPALYFNLSSCLYALATVAYSLVAGLPVEDAGAHVLLHHHAELLVASRLISLAAWLGLGATVFAIARSCAEDARAGLLAAFLLLPLDTWRATEFSPYAVSSLLAYAFVYLAGFRRIDQPLSARDAVSAGALAGGAVAAHYLAAIFLPVFLWALWARPQRRRLATFAAFAGAAAAVFLVANFRVFTNPNDYLATLRYRVQEISEFDPRSVNVAPARDFSQDAAFYFAYLAGQPLGWLGLGGLVVGVLRYARSTELALGLLVLLPLYLVALLSAFATKYDRYLIFVYPAMATLASCWLREAFHLLRALDRETATVVVFTALSFLLGPWIGVAAAAFAVARRLGCDGPAALLAPLLVVASGAWDAPEPAEAHATVPLALAAGYAAAFVAPARAVTARARALLAAATAALGLGLLAVLRTAGGLRTAFDHLAIFRGRVGELGRYDAREAVLPDAGSLDDSVALVTICVAAAGLVLWATRAVRQAWAAAVPPLVALALLAGGLAIAGDGSARLCAWPALAIGAALALEEVARPLRGRARAVAAVALVAAGASLAGARLGDWAAARVTVSLAESDPVPAVAAWLRTRPAGAPVGVASLIAAPFEEAVALGRVDGALARALGSAFARAAGHEVAWVPCASDRAPPPRVDWLQVVEWNDDRWVRSSLEREYELRSAGRRRVGGLVHARFQVEARRR